MPNANVMGTPWTDGARAYLALQVAVDGNKEYIGSVSLTDDLAAVGFPGQTWAQLSAANKKAALVTATKAVRDAAVAGQATIAGITGTVTI